MNPTAAITPSPQQPPSSMMRRTQRMYDRLAPVYPISSYLFHADAHRAALAQSGVRDGMRVLEVATGSGELFRRLLRINPNGKTIGIDLAERMALRTHRMAQKDFPRSSSQCISASGCKLPLADQSFDRIFSCLMLELLDDAGRRSALHEFRRVLRPGGRVTLVLIGEDSSVFNWVFKRCVKVVPAFWGPQTEQAVHDLFDEAGLQLIAKERVRQNGYPSLILTLQ